MCTLLLKQSFWGNKLLSGTVYIWLASIQYHVVEGDGVPSYMLHMLLEGLAEHSCIIKLGNGDLVSNSLWQCSIHLNLRVHWFFTSSYISLKIDT